MNLKYVLIFAFCTLSCVLSFGQNKTLVLDDLNPNNFNRDFSKFDQKTAIFCAQVSNMLYYDLSLIDLRVNILQTKYPEHDIRYKFFNEERSSDTQNEVLFFGTKDFVLIAFRGSSSLKDWKTNLIRKNAKFNSSREEKEYRNLPAGHAGFRKSMKNLIDLGIFEELKSFMLSYTSNTKDFPVYMTGHSLGGALAVMAMRPLTYKNQFNFQGCYNFAPALAISCTMNEAINKEFGDRVYDIVNYVDFISRANYKHFRHIGKFHRMVKYDDRRGCGERTGLLFHQKERLSGFTFLEGLVFPKTIYQYHNIDAYIKNLKLVDNNNDKVELRGFDNGCNYGRENKLYEKRQCKVKNKE